MTARRTTFHFHGARAAHRSAFHRRPRRRIGRPCRWAMSGRRSDGSATLPPHHPQDQAPESRHSPVRRRSPRCRQDSKYNPFPATRWPVPTCWASARAQDSASRCSCWAPPCWASRDTRSSVAGRGRAAWLGSALVLAIVMAVSRRIKDIMVILILGMMLSFGHQFGGRNPPIPVGQGGAQIVRHLDRKVAGRRHRATSSRCCFPVVTAGLALAVAVIKPLNLLLLGELCPHDGTQRAAHAR